MPGRRGPVMGLSMTLRRAAAALCLFLPASFAASLATGTRAEPPPVEAFAQLPLVTGADLSPGGRRVVTTSNIDGSVVVTVLDLQSRQWRPILRGERDGFRVHWCRFKTDERLLCGLRGVSNDFGPLETATRLIAVDADGANQKVLVFRRYNDSQDPHQDRVLSWLPDDPDHVLVQFDSDLDNRPTVFRLNVRTGRMDPETPAFGKVRRFFADRAGQVRVALEFKDLDVALWTRADGKAEWRLLARHRVFGEGGTEFMGFAADRDRVYLQRGHRGRGALWEFDLTERAEPKLVFSHPEVDIDGPEVWNERMVGVKYQAERPEIHFVDAEARGLFGAIKGAFPGTFPEMLATSRDGRQLLVQVYADRQPPLYALLDRGSGKVEILAQAYPKLRAEQLATMKSITYPARDGTKIPGYLTIPNGAAPSRLPLVVMPHGGPIHRDTWNFDFLPQFLVSRGYAVLQMDFRGSSGYGGAWFKAAHQDWGGLTYDDVIDGVRWAIDRGIADGRRVAVVGWSFGGYVALLGAVRDPALLRCAVSIAGVSDLKGLERSSKPFTNAAVVREQLGTDDDKLAANSPRALAANAGVPILMFHGSDDIQVPVLQGRGMSSALRKAGKPHEYIEYRDETHQIDHEKNRIDMLRRIEAFLAEHLAARKDTAATP